MEDGRVWFGLTCDLDCTNREAMGDCEMRKIGKTGPVGGSPGRGGRGACEGCGSERCVLLWAIYS